MSSFLLRGGAGAPGGRLKIPHKGEVPLASPLCSLPLLREFLNLQRRLCDLCSLGSASSVFWNVLILSPYPATQAAARTPVVTPLLAQTESRDHPLLRSNPEPHPASSQGREMS